MNCCRNAGGILKGFLQESLVISLKEPSEKFLGESLGEFLEEFLVLYLEEFLEDFSEHSLKILL